MQYVLIATLFIIAVIGWFRREKPSRITSFVIMILLLVSAIMQAIRVREESREKHQLETSLSSVTSANDHLLVQNRTLLASNEEFLTRIESYQQEIELQRETIETLRDYSDIAALDPTGKDISAGSGLTYKTAISAIVEDAFYELDGKLYCKCDQTAKDRLMLAVEKHPRFPFSYYCLAVCLHKRGDDRWRKYAEKAIEILEKTTIIAGHKPEHDQALSELRSLQLK